jgi:hypothetical protein
MPEEALTGQSPVIRAAYTGAWYVTRVLWYGFPWSIAGAVFAAARLRRREWLPSSPFRGDEQGGRAAWFAVVSGLVLTAVFSLAHRKADRYIFPVYFLVASAGAGALLRRWPPLAELARRADRAWLPAAVYVVLVLLTILSSGRLPQFTFWRT